MNKDITNSLIEEYVAEAYAKVTVDDIEKKAALDAFEAELVNGPEVEIRGMYGPRRKKVGSFDLINFHKAYDGILEELGLLDIFGTDGKLTSRGSYGRIKEVKDRKLASALKQLWAIQYSSDSPRMEFFDADTPVKRKALEIYNKYGEEKFEVADRLEKEMSACSAYLELLEIIPEKYKSSSTGELNLWIDFDSPLSSSKTSKFWASGGDRKEVIVNTYKIKPFTVEDLLSTWEHISLRIENLPILATVSSKLCKLCLDNPGDMSLEDAKTELLKKFTDQIAEIKKVLTASVLLISLYDDIASSPEGALLTHHKVEWFSYLDRATNNLYKGVIKLFGGRKGIILYNIDDKSDVIFDKPGSFVPACALADESSDSGRCYSMDTHTHYFNSHIDQAILEVLGVSFRERSVVMGDCLHIVPVTEPEVAKAFDKKSVYRYECDSSD